MVDSQTRGLPVLIASDSEWEGRSIESVLELNGYSVIRIERGRRALELARRTPLGALFLDAGLADMGGIEVCRALRDDPLFDHSTPIVVTSAGPAAHRASTAAYAAGAWRMQPADRRRSANAQARDVRRRQPCRSRSAKLCAPRSSTGLYISIRN